MIVRAWRARALPAAPDAYVEHFRRHVATELRRVPGFLGASVLRGDRAGAVEFLVLTRWASMDAVRAFAGDRVTRAVVDPEAADALASFDAAVEHYEVVEKLPGAGAI